jgi:hypothetical protein
MSAIISKDGKYRYQLGREWEAGLSPGIVTWIMLNPSTASESLDDPTIRRCVYFSKGFGFSSLLVGNLYAYRATLRSLLWNYEMNNGDIVGPQNDFYLSNMADISKTIILAWGDDADDKRVFKVMELLAPWRKKMRILGLTKYGWPRHPLYMPKDSKLLPLPAEWVV